MRKPPDMPAEVPPHWLTYFTVDDTDAMVAKATQLGASVMAEPFDVPGIARIAASSTRRSPPSA